MLPLVDRIEFLGNFFCYQFLVVDIRIYFSVMKELGVYFEVYMSFLIFFRNHFQSTENVRLKVQLKYDVKNKNGKDHLMMKKVIINMEPEK